MDFGKCTRIRRCSGYGGIGRNPYNRVPQTSAAKIVVMDVAGSGKTTLGRELAASLQAEFLDADDFHTPQARARMARGEALTDADRAPWPARLAAELQARTRVVLACSALKQTYRDVLRAGPVRFIFLDLPEEVLQARLLERQGHYAGAGLLASQLATLERPTRAETDVTTLAISESSTPATLLERALKALG